MLPRSDRFSRLHQAIIDEHELLLPERVDPVHEVLGVHVHVHALHLRPQSVHDALDAIHVGGVECDVGARVSAARIHGRRPPLHDVSPAALHRVQNGLQGGAKELAVDDAVLAIARDVGSEESGADVMLRRQSRVLHLGIEVGAVPVQLAYLVDELVLEVLLVERVVAVDGCAAHGRVVQLRSVVPLLHIGREVGREDLDARLQGRTHRSRRRHADRFVTLEHLTYNIVHTSKIRSWMGKVISMGINVGSIAYMFLIRRSAR